MTARRCNNQDCVDFVEDAAGNRTTYGYDSGTGQRIAVTDALTNTTYTAYDVQGRVVGTWGATYPVLYDYDDYGRMTAMYTLRDDTIATNDSYSGFRSQVSGFDQTRWHYDEAIGLLTNKSYADSSSVSYSYDLAGRLARRTWARGVTTDYDYDAMGQLETIDYSDSTPDVAFTYDRVGRQLTITDVLGTRTNTYDPSTLVLTEEQLPDGTTLVRTYDSLGRSSGFTLDSDYAVNYGYDDMGRFDSVSFASLVFNYSFVPGSDLLAGYTNTVGLSVERIYEPDRNLIASIENRFGGALVSQFDYENDAIGRRTLRVDTLSTTNVFGYNLRSELTEATMGTNVFGYIYDPIGNRKTTDRGQLTTTYLANELNQYLLVTNASHTSSLSYDGDGNLTNDGTFAYTWDAENRLITVYSNETMVMQNAYDYMSRRVEKTTSASTNRFIYDGWNMIRELVTDNGSLVTNSYVWGLDLNGTLQGAGGIGGLLAQYSSSPSYSVLFFFCDANGNVTDLVDTNGSTVAHYEYDPYGNPITTEGAEAQSNPYRFSTKYEDDETGLLYYGFRYYSPELGRWLSRDPIMERGGNNLYNFVRNDPLRRWDFLGLNCTVSFNCLLVSETGAGDCDKHCEYQCYETRRDPSFGGSVTCDDLPSATMSITDGNTAFGSALCHLTGGMCGSKGSCSGSYSTSRIYGLDIPGRDCSRSACIAGCDTAKTLMDAACDRLSGASKRACQASAASVHLICVDSCNSWCLNP